MIRSIFYNDERFTMRAGWRMILFVLLAMIMSTGVGGALKLLHDSYQVKLSNVLTEAILYSVILFATYLMLTIIDRRPLRAVGLVAHGKVLKELGQGFLVGGGLMAVIFFGFLGAGWLSWTPRPYSVSDLMTASGTSIAIFAVGGFGEELLFRGYLFQTLVEGTNKFIAVLIFAVVFGLAHLGNPNVTVFAVANVALAGVLLSLAYFKTRTLWFATGIHFSWNFLQNHVFGFQVSGLEFTQYRFADVVVTGPDWLTGGSFGPEGGAVATVILITGSVLVSQSRWFVQSERVWTLEQWWKDRLASRNDLITTA